MFETVVVTTKTRQIARGGRTVWPRGGVVKVDTVARRDGRPATPGKPTREVTGPHGAIECRGRSIPALADVGEDAGARVCQQALPRHGASRNARVTDQFASLCCGYRSVTGEFDWLL
jgi:hypothetical protein